MTSINTISTTKGSYLQKIAEQKNQTTNSEEAQTQSAASQDETKAEEKPEKLPSYKAIEALEQKAGNIDAENLYNARWSLYRKDLEKSNEGRAQNEIGVVSQRSWDNSKKIITTEEEGKAHINDFAEKLKEELINQGNFSSRIEKALEYVLNNFKWSTYLEKFPNRDANYLEWQFLHTLASAVDTNRIATIFY